MKEQLYTIPVNDAFNVDCECPLCAMRNTLEENAILFTMGPSYMEEDVRAKTDDLGFCSHHVKMLNVNQNRLGLALILDTHLNKINKDLKKLMDQKPKISSPSLFKKHNNSSDIKDYIDNLNSSCFICDKINNIYNHYTATVFYLYKSDESFVDKFKHSKGLCINHYGLLYDQAPNYLKGDTLESFILILNNLYLENMMRVEEELAWFIDKFDYRNSDEPWKNSKDAIPRAMMKTNGIFYPTTTK